MFTNSAISLEYLTHQLPSAPEGTEVGKQTHSSFGFMQRETQKRTHRFRDAEEEKQTH
jgi:hypothetical protein